MSEGQQLYDTPTFGAAVRGYDKKQVDRHVAEAADRIARLSAEREQAHAHIRSLSGNLEQIHGELTDLREHPPRLDRASFRHLGSMVDEILALSEKQGQAIVDAAGQRAAEIQQDAEGVLEAARAQAERLHAEGVEAREAADEEARRQHEASVAAIERAEGEARARIESAHEQTKQDLTQWRTDVERELTEQRTAADEANAARQADADQQLAERQQQLSAVQKEIEARQQALTQMRAAQESAQQQLGQLRHDGSAVEQELAQLTHRLGGTRQELASELSRLESARQAAEATERQTIEARARMQREAKRMADRAAAAVMAAAAISEQTGEFKMIAIQPDPAQLIEPTAEQFQEPERVIEGEAITTGEIEPAADAAQLDHTRLEPEDFEPVAGHEPEPAQVAPADEAAETQPVAMARPTVEQVGFFQPLNAGSPVDRLP